LGAGVASAVTSKVAEESHNSSTLAVLVIAAWDEDASASATLDIEVGVRGIVVGVAELCRIIARDSVADSTLDRDVEDVVFRLKTSMGVGPAILM
jgi:hypothetical protein